MRQRDVMAQKKSRDQQEEEEKSEETSRSLVVISSLWLDVIGNRREKLVLCLLDKSVNVLE